jgi:hypothetical protein
MCVRAYRRRVSVMDVRVFCACARGERLSGVINIIIKRKRATILPLKNRAETSCGFAIRPLHKEYY